MTSNRAGFIVRTFLIEKSAKPVTNFSIDLAPLFGQIIDEFMGIPKRFSMLFSILEFFLSPSFEGDAFKPCKRYSLVIFFYKKSIFPIINAMLCRPIIGVSLIKDKINAHFRS